MAYEVVARRWRPLTFASVVGQTHVTRTLANAIRRDRIPHAFLMTGTRGVGKTTIARLLARAVNCSGRGEGAEPCNQCPSCLASLAGNSMDIIEIDAASNTGVDNVRDLIESSQYRPALGRYKVFIIDEVHMLSRGAFNALLKTLEEPPAHAKFILATTDVHKLPPTVLSRCQRYHFHRLSDDEIARQLATIAERDGMQVDREGIALIAREADGSMRDAQSLLEQVMAGAEGPMDAGTVAALLGVAGGEIISGIVEAIVGADAARVVDLVGEVRRFGYDSERLLGEVLEVLRDLTVVTVAGEGAISPSTGESTRQLVVSLKGKRSALDLHRVFSSLLQTASDLRRGGHPDLVLEMGLLKVASLEPVETAAALLARLGVLESSSGRPAAAAARPSAAPPSQGSQAHGGPRTTPPPSPNASQPRTPAPSGRSAGEGAPASAARPANSSAGSGSTQPASNPVPPAAASRGGRLPLAGKATAEAVEAWTGPEGEPLEPLSEEEAQARRWEAFLDDVKKRYGLDLYVTITNCRATSITPEHVDIAPIAAGFAQKLRNPTVMSRVTEVARAHFGEAVVVRVTEAGEGLSLQGIQDERTARKKASALADPFVDKAVSGLGGRVTKISVLEE